MKKSKNWLPLIIYLSGVFAAFPFLINQQYKIYAKSDYSVGVITQNDLVLISIMSVASWGIFPIWIVATFISEHDFDQPVFRN